MSAVTPKHMAALLTMVKEINLAGQTSLDSAVHRAIEFSSGILECDRSSMFIVDEITDQLLVRDASGSDVDIRIPMNAGIAGAVYCKGEIVNIPDAYKDERFNKDTDAKTGYKTTSLLCSPVYDSHGNTIAVLEAINKKNKSGDGFVPFTKEDEVLIDYMAGQLGVILLNAKIYEDAQKSQKKVEAMMDIVRALHGDVGVNSMSFTITEKTPQLVEADRCTLYLVDEQHSELWTISGGVTIRIPKASGIAGLVATGGKIVNIPDAYQDSRFNQDYDKKSGYHTKTILALPITNSEKKIVGVLQLINKASGPFSEGDEQLLEGFLSIVGGIIENSNLFAYTRERKGTDEQGCIEDNPRMLVKEKSTKLVVPMGAFEEGDEEEEEED